ncbi:hypothetical protein O181_042184 [Austropuccinia psidii MF-1]|uniref:Uncharacterized protein n=1 Tax=Austropuccinia psidii MF-1 TaxID=1389203 RepID=A0A9Q3DFX1_9BASI|nr:hypothetical protein [Austropuccinia psidii MF-1]
MGQLTQEVFPRRNSQAPEFKNPSMKAPDSSYGTQAHKSRGFLQACQLIFHNDKAKFFYDMAKVLYSNYLIAQRARIKIEPYLSIISNEDLSCLLNNWKLFETQLFTHSGDPNELREAEKELLNLRMKESDHFSLYQLYLRILIPRIRHWGEIAQINVYRRGLESRLLDQSASHPVNFDNLSELMEISLKLDTRCC